MILFAITIVALAIVATVACGKTNGGAVLLHDFNVPNMLPLRGVCAILIIMLHVAQNIPQVPVLNELTVWGGLVVSIFFFMSGYGLMISYLKKGNSYLDGFLTRRFVKLLPAFLLTTVIYQVYQSWTGCSTLAESLAELRHGCPILPDSWFVIVILLYYLLFYLCARVCRRPLFMVLVLWLLTGVYLTIVLSLGWQIFWSRSVCAINVGFTFALVEGRVKQFLSRSQTTLIGAVWVIVVVMLAIIAAKYCGVGLTNFLNYLLPLLLVLVVYSSGKLNSRVFTFLGTISYEIYIAQCVFRHKLYFTASIHWSIYLILTIVASIIVAILLNHITRICTKK